VPLKIGPKSIDTSKHSVLPKININTRKIPISTAAHLIHDLSGIGKCPFLGVYFTLEKPMKGGLIYKFL